MIRVFQKKIKIKAFSMDASSFAALWQALRSDWNEDDEWRIESLTARHGASRYEFSMPDDLLQNCPEGRLTNVRLTIREASKSIEIDASDYFLLDSTVEVDGPDEIWCATRVETIRSYLSENRAWHSWLTGRLLLTFTAVLPLLLLLALRTKINEELSAQAVWLTTISLTTLLVFLLLLVISKGKIIPNGVIFHGQHEHWIRRYATEIGLSLALIAAITGIASLLR